MSNMQGTSNAMEVPVPQVRPTLSVAYNPEAPEEVEVWKTVNRVVVLRKAETENQRYGVKQLLEDFMLNSQDFLAAVARWEAKFGSQPGASAN